jgi:signal recognition particle GTPase
MSDSLAARKDVLTKTLKSMQSFDIENDSNFKFMNLVRSRLTEEDIPLDIATRIVANLDYDLSAVNEDDDYIGDAALAYAEFASRVYFRLEATNWHRNMPDSLIRKYFSPFKVTL